MNASQPRICSIDGCGRKHNCRGWCKAHYKRWLRHGDTGPAEIRKRPEVCEILGCGKSHKAYGWCRSHYNRWLRWGDPLGPFTDNDDLPGESWQPIRNYEGLYEVSDLGRVRSLPRYSKKSGLQGGRILKPCENNRGRLNVTLSRNNVPDRRMIHHLVLEAFAGPPLPGQITLHGPGGRLDNRLSNLKWGTPVENNMDMIRDDTLCQGDRKPNAKLSEAAVRDLRQRFAAGGVTKRGLARELEVSEKAIRAAILHQTWKSVA